MTQRTSDSRLRQVFTNAYGGLPRAFWVQWVGVLVNRLGTFVEPFLALYLTTARGLSIGQTGLILAIHGAGCLVGPVLGGFLADRLSRRVALAGSMVAAALAMVGLGLATTPVAITAAGFVVGLTADLYRPASGAMVADLVPLAHRSRAYGLLFWAINLGFAIAAVGGGWLAERGYGLLFGLDAATCLVFGLLIFFLVRTPEQPRARTDEPAVGYRSALRDPLVVALIALTVLYSTIYTQAYVTLPLSMHMHGLSAAQFGAAIALNGVVIVLIQPFAAVWFQRFQPLHVLAVSGLVVGIGFGLTAFAQSQWAYAGTVVVWTLGEIGMAGYAQSLVSELAPPAARGRYQALFTLGFSSSMILAPVAGTTLLATVGPAGPWIGCVVGGVVLFVGHLMLSGPVNRRREAANSRTVTTTA
ncbi:MFS transporter [Fodinicola feengrottensis]|uniref:MFS transporter n=1 Tax=Fodinicola feengrottensis TaxID=435914 RepID=A0ABN2GVW1_9ACTN